MWRWIVGAALLAYLTRGVSQVTTWELRWFSPSEFGPSLPFLRRELLLALDEYRDRLGVPVVLSSALDGGLFRDGGGTSQHALGRAADIRWPVGVTKQRAYELACQVFSGVGVYSWGLHLDVRTDRQAGAPATWGRIYNADGTWRDVAALEVLRGLA